MKHTLTQKPVLLGVIALTAIGLGIFGIANARRSHAPPEPPLSILETLSRATQLAEQVVDTPDSQKDDQTIINRIITVTSDGFHETLTTADGLLPDLPPGVATKTGSAYREHLVNLHGQRFDPAFKSLIEKEWQGLIEVAEDRPDRYTLTLINSPEVNAFAFIGHNVAVTEGFTRVLRDCDSPELVLRFVLAHELGHIKLGHTERMFRRVAAAERLAPGAGIAPAMTEAIIKSTPFNQALERDADCFARELLLANNWSLQGGIEFFRWCQRHLRQKHDDTLGWMLQSHPSDNSRIALLLQGTGCR